MFADINEEAARTAAETSKQFATNPEYRGLSCYVDITELDSLNKMMDFTLKEGGRVDYAVNAAGVSLAVNCPVSKAITQGIVFADPTQCLGRATFLQTSRRN